MEQTVVSSYVRGRKVHEVEPEQSYAIALVIGGSSLLLVALVYWYISLPLGLTTGALYGLKVLIGQSAPVKTVEAVQPAAEKDKPKRHYEHRLTVKHYQSNKIVRI